MTKFVFVTGGVVSSLGKGIAESVPSGAAPGQLCERNVEVPSSCSRSRVRIRVASC